MGLLRMRTWGAALVLLAVACGGDPGAAPVSAPTVPAPAPAPEPEPTPEILRVDFDSHPLGRYTEAAARADWREVEHAIGLAEGRAEIIGAPDAWSGHSLRHHHAGGGRVHDHSVQVKVLFGRSYEELFVSYRVRFGRDFDFVLGGKLPGFFGGTGNTGGQVPDGMDGWSARMMWLEGGAAIQYLYHPDQPGAYGDNLPWGRTFQRGTWHTVAHRIVMNAPGQHDGVLQTWFDGEETLHVQDLRFRDVDTFAIGGFYLVSFFGGGDDDWNTTKDEHIDFDDFVVSTELVQNLLH